MSNDQKKGQGHQKNLGQVFKKMMGAGEKNFKRGKILGSKKLLWA